MHPVLFSLGPVTIYTYGLMLVVAFAAAVGLARRAARRSPPEFRALDSDQVIDFASCSLLGGILGGRVFYVALHWEAFAGRWQDIPAIWHGGLIWYGGFLGGLVSGWLYVRMKRVRFMRALDQFIPFLALGHALGRIGCFLNGCCYGTPTDAWCGVTFPGHGEPVLPTQLFEAAGLFALFLVLRRLQQPSWLRQPGRLFGVYLVGYAALRFVLEWFRGDQAPLWAGLTLPQLISIAVFCSGFVLCLHLREGSLR